MPRRLLSAMLGLALTATVLADDWPQWRGLNRDAVSLERGLLDHWEDAPLLVWKAGGLGAGEAGAAIQNGIVYTVGNPGGKVSLIALSEMDGSVIWRTKIGKHTDAGEGQSTPTVDGERVYALTRNGVLACLGTATGEVLWEKAYKQDFEGQTQDQGFAESPLVDGDKLICTPGGPEAGIVALDKRSGQELWRTAPTDESRFDGKKVTYSSVVISHGAGVRQYVQVTSSGLLGIDATTGKQLWIYKWKSQKFGNNYCYSTPIIRDDYVFYPCGGVLLKLVPTGDGGVEANEIYALKEKTFNPRTGGAVLVGDYLYGCQSDGTPQCIEFLTGKSMWKENEGEEERGLGSGYGGAAVIYADGNLYFKYEKGMVGLVAARPDKYELKGQFHSRLGPHAHPALSNGRLYIRGSGAIHCYDVRKQ